MRVEGLSLTVRARMQAVNGRRVYGTIATRTGPVAKGIAWPSGSV